MDDREIAVIYAKAAYEEAEINFKEAESNLNQIIIKLTAELNKEIGVYKAHLERAKINLSKSKELLKGTEEAAEKKFD